MKIEPVYRFNEEDFDPKNVLRVSYYNKNHYDAIEPIDSGRNKILLK